MLNDGSFGKIMCFLGEAFFFGGGVALRAGPDQDISAVFLISVAGII